MVDAVRGLLFRCKKLYCQTLTGAGLLDLPFRLLVFGKSIHYIIFFEVTSSVFKCLNGCVSVVERVRIASQKKIYFGLNGSSRKENLCTSQNSLLLATLLHYRVLLRVDYVTIWNLLPAPDVLVKRGSCHCKESIFLSKGKFRKWSRFFSAEKYSCINGFGKYVLRG